MKRLFDIILVMMVLPIVVPVGLSIALAVWVTSGTPVLYRGSRVGRFGAPFRIMKFRTMVVDAERLGGPSTSNLDQRITPLGRLLRSCKLDELPQIMNVLTGDMSLVGPRPEVQKYVDMYTDRERPILSLRPGITDWASIWNADEGAVLAGAIDPDRAYEELIRPTKLQLQLKYVDESSLRVDLRILCATALRIIRRNWVPAEIASYRSLLPVPDPRHDRGESTRI